MAMKAQTRESGSPAPEDLGEDSAPQYSLHRRENAASRGK